MTVTDSDRFAVAMAKLSQARSAVYEATRIIEHLFEADGPQQECMVLHEHPTDVCDTNSRDTITGLYPGQIPDILDCADEEPESVECLE